MSDLPRDVDDDGQRARTAEEERELRRQMQQPGRLRDEIRERAAAEVDPQFEREIRPGEIEVGRDGPQLRDDVLEEALREEAAREIDEEVPIETGVDDIVLVDDEPQLAEQARRELAAREFDDELDVDVDRDDVLIEGDDIQLDPAVETRAEVERLQDELRQAEEDVFFPFEDHDARAFARATQDYLERGAFRMSPSVVEFVEGGDAEWVADRAERALERRGDYRAGDIDPEFVREVREEIEERRRTFQDDPAAFELDDSWTMRELERLHRADLEGDQVRRTQREISQQLDDQFGIEMGRLDIEQAEGIDVDVTADQVVEFDDAFIEEDLRAGRADLLDEQIDHTQIQPRDLDIRDGVPVPGEEIQEEIAQRELAPEFEQELPDQTAVDPTEDIIIDEDGDARLRDEFWLEFYGEQLEHAEVGEDDLVFEDGVVDIDERVVQEEQLAAIERQLEEQLREDDDRVETGVELVDTLEASPDEFGIDLRPDDVEFEDDGEVRLREDAAAEFAAQQFRLRTGQDISPDMVEPADDDGFELAEEGERLLAVDELEDETGLDLDEDDVVLDDGEFGLAEDAQREWEREQRAEFDAPVDVQHPGQWLIEQRTATAPDAQLVEAIDEQFAQYDVQADDVDVVDGQPVFVQQPDYDVETLAEELDAEPDRIEQEIRSAEIERGPVVDEMPELDIDDEELADIQMRRPRFTETTAPEPSRLEPDGPVDLTIDFFRGLERERQRTRDEILDVTEPVRTEFDALTDTAEDVAPEILTGAAVGAATRTAPQAVRISPPAAAATAGAATIAAPDIVDIEDEEVTPTVELGELEPEEPFVREEIEPGEWRPESELEPEEPFVDREIQPTDEVFVPEVTVEDPRTTTPEIQIRDGEIDMPFEAGAVVDQPVHRRRQPDEPLREDEDDVFAPPEPTIEREPVEPAEEPVVRERIVPEEDLIREDTIRDDIQRDEMWRERHEPRVREDDVVPERVVREQVSDVPQEAALQPEVATTVAPELTTEVGTFGQPVPEPFGGLAPEVAHRDTPQLADELMPDVFQEAQAVAQTTPTPTLQTRPFTQPAVDPMARAEAATTPVQRHQVQQQLAQPAQQAAVQMHPTPTRPAHPAGPAFAHPTVPATTTPGVMRPMRTPEDPPETVTVDDEGVVEDEIDWRNPIALLGMGQTGADWRQVDQQAAGGADFSEVLGEAEDDGGEFPWQ